MHFNHVGLTLAHRYFLGYKHKPPFCTHIQRCSPPFGKVCSDYCNVCALEKPLPPSPLPGATLGPSRQDTC